MNGSKFTWLAGVRLAILVQLPLIVLSLILGLCWGGFRVEPGFAAVLQWLRGYGLLLGPPLGLVGFVVGAAPAECVPRR
jgi:hypothetical protein